MIKQNEVNKLPKSVNRYVLVKTVLLITLLSIPFGFVGEWFAFWWTMIIIIGIPVSLIVILGNNHTTFSVDNNKIQINWGIITKKSRSIMLNNIQNISIEKGLLMSMFGISCIKIWTASQSQVVRDKKGDSVKPDGLLTLKKEDSQWLNEFLSKK